MSPRQHQTNILLAGLRQLILLVFSTLALYPIYYMVITAFKTRNDWLHNQFGLPSPITFQNFADALSQGNIPLWFGNSVIVTVASIVLSTIVSALAAYSIARFRFAGRLIYFNSMIALMVVPPAVLILPLFVFMVKIGMINTLTDVAMIEGFMDSQGPFNPGNIAAEVMNYGGFSGNMLSPFFGRPTSAQQPRRLTVGTAFRF